MKPGDHPEFFRFPAPAGRSRESTIVLDRAGRFWHDGERLENQAMARAFARWIGRHPDDGRYILSNGYDWTYLTIEGAPFFVTGVRQEQDELWIHLTDDTWEELVGPVWVGPEDALHAAVKNGAYHARWLPSVQARLGDVLQENESGWELRVGGRALPIHAGPPPPWDRVSEKRARDADRTSGETA